MTMQVIYTLGAYFIFAAAVGAMEKPTPQSTRFYGWLYRFLQRLAANADRVAEAKFGVLAEAAATSDDTTAIAAAVVTKP